MAAAGASGYTGPPRNVLQGVTTALPRSVIGGSFPELNQPLSHRKRQCFSVGKDGTRAVGEARTKGLPRDLDAKEFRKIDVKRIQAAYPEWTTLREKTLRFFAYFKETVVEARWESHRVRRVAVLFYLEDDTMQVSEPRQQNSGMAQGALLKRHKVPRPGEPDAFYGPDDLRVGETLEFYGKKALLVDCDAATREFYERLGRPQGDACTVPSDEHSTWREAKEQRGTKDADLRRVMELAASQRAGGTIHKISADEREVSRSFFRPDNQVLRYYCEWHDPSVHGETHRFRLLYFQVDGTCVVSEEIGVNAGRDPSSTFLKRQRLPKADPVVGYTAVSLETVSRRRGVGEAYYGEDDFGIGRTVNVYGRELVICDMDESTKRYYEARGTGGVGDDGKIHPIERSPAPANASLTQSTSRRKVLGGTPPPYNGFGSEEDSLGSWKNLVLKPPKRDCARELRDRDKVLRFGASIKSNSPMDKGRNFILSYFLADNTLQIYEQPSANSGIVGGKFLVRQRIRTSDPGMPAEYLQPQELFLGAEVTVNATTFVLNKADERTVALMEGHPKVFTVASAQEILSKLRDAVLLRHSQIAEAFRYFDKDHSGMVTADELRQVLHDQQMDVSDHEVMTLMRYFDTDGDGVISFHEFVERMIPSDHSSALDKGQGVVPLAEIEHDVRRYEDVQRAVGNKRVAASAFKRLVDKLVAKSVVVQDVFRQMAGGADKAYVTEADMRTALNERLQLDLPEHEMRALLWRFFYDPATNVKRARLTLPEFVRVLESAPVK